ncbi:MAG TPA: HXXEE domain-containing protein [Ignavibacteria bacterium]|mgnify:CR=1 FL=1|nr:HXXEE domain-containing protein [Ignavibacteria bacterium]
MELIYRHWAKLGGVIAAGILVYIYVIQGARMPLVQKFSLLSLAFLMFHQFEEYVYPDGFQQYFNTRIYNPFGFFKNKISDKAVIWVNVVFGWGVYGIVAIFFHDNHTLVMIFVAVLLINGLLHFGVSFSVRDYNPGVVTGAILFLPLAIYSGIKLKESGVMTTPELVMVLPYAAGFSLLIPITIYVCRDKKR